MQKLISQIPELSAYLSRLPKSEHLAAVKQIVKTGLQAMQPHCCKQNLPRPSNITNQIDRIKENLVELNQIVKHQCHHCCACIYPTNEYRYSEQPKQPQNNFRPIEAQDNSGKTFSFKPSRDNGPQFQPPVKQTSNNYAKSKQKGVLNQTDQKTVNPFSKTKVVISRHHLDDRQAKEALTFPPEILTQVHHPSKRRSQQYKKHIYQEEINKEEQVKLKEERDDNDFQHRATRAVTDYKKATSKIKSLLDVDRIRFQQRQQEQSFRDGFNKYEYSDENQMEESSISNQEPERENPQRQKSNRASYEDNTYNQQYQSSFKASNQASSSQKPSSKKDFERSKKQVSSKLEVSQGEPLQRPESHGKESSIGKNLQFRPSQRASDNYNQEEDDVVSNSSSFSQFSISGSQKRDVGKISRRNNNLT